MGNHVMAEVLFKLCRQFVVDVVELIGHLLERFRRNLLYPERLLSSGNAKPNAPPSSKFSVIGEKFARHTTRIPPRKDGGIQASIGHSMSPSLV